MITVSVKMETKRKKNNSGRSIRGKLPIYKDICSFEGYDASSLMSETAKLRNLITKRGTLELLIPFAVLPSQ